MGLKRCDHLDRPNRNYKWADLLLLSFSARHSAGSNRTPRPPATGAEHAEKAMDVLRRAVSLGYRCSHAHRSEDALGALRGRLDFKLLLMDLSVSAEPFAVAR